MSEATDARRLLAQGTPITLADGSSRSLVIQARALAQIEDRYGCLDAYIGALKPATGGKLFHHLAFTFSVCLGVSEDEAWDLMDTRLLESYVAAIGAAMQEALPMEEANPSGNGVAAPAGASPGAATSGSPSPSGTSLPSSSGA